MPFIAGLPRPRMRRNLDRGLLVGIGLVVALLLTSAVLTYRNTNRLDEDAGWVAHTHYVLDLTADVLLTLVDAETGQRGFLVTGRDEFLQPYNAALATLDERLALLKENTKDNDRQQSRVEKLKQMAAGVVTILKQGIDLRRRGADGAQLLTHMTEGKERMDAIRAQVADMEREERALLTDRQRQSSQSYKTALVTGVVTALAGLAMVGAFVWLLDRNLSARQKAAAVLHEQREWFRTTLMSIGDAVITTDTDGRATSLNAAAQGLTGWNADEAVGQPLESVFHIVNEQTRQRAENPAHRSLREGTVVGLANHTLLIGKDGRERPIDDSAAPIRSETGEVSGVVLVFRDVTLRRQLERLQQDLQGQLERQVQERTADLRRSEERFRLLVEGTKDYAIFMLDPHGNVASWNPGAQRTKGYTADEIIGQHFSRFYPAEDREQGKPVNALATAEAQGKYEEEGWRVRKDGSRFWASVVITSLRDEAGNLRGFSKITRDVTQRKEGEESARRLLQEQAARQAAEASALALHNERERLHVTLHSIGDAVIATDAQGRVTLLNPVAEFLTGWNQDEAVGRPLDEVFAITNEMTGRSAENPVARVLREGRVVGLANHTVLRARSGATRPIDDSAAPIKDAQGQTLGVVLVFHDVSEKRQAEAAVRENEEKFRLLADTIPQLAWMARPDGHIFWYNRGWYEYTGATPEQMEGWGWQSVHDPQTLPKVLARWQECIASGEPFEMIFPLRGADGRFRSFLTRIHPLRDEAGGIRYWCGTNTDISEQQRAADAAQFLADASATLAAVVDYESTLGKVARLAVPFFADWCTVDMAGPDGTLRRLAVVHVDPSRVGLADELYRRYPPRPDAPHGPPQVLRTGQAEMVSEITDAVLAASALDEDHLRILRELGLRSYLCVPLAARGKPLGVLTFIRSESGPRYGPADLTLAEDLAHRAATAIENAQLYGALREADRLKDEFLAMLAHELRNPLSPILHTLHIMKQPEANGAIVAQARDLAERQVQHMARLLDDLLDVSRISRGRIELRKEPVDVASLVGRSVEAVRLLVEDRRHELTVSLPEELVRLEGDPTRLEQVMVNLLNNACKYTDPGGRIDLSAAKEGDEVVLRVRDTGIGIAPGTLPRIFDLFVQAERRLDRSQGGVGVGLTLVERLVKLHGGMVEAHSEGLGRGSEFVVRLPAYTHEDQPQSEGAVGRSLRATSLPTRRILVVDDNHDAAESLAMLLRLRGQEVRTAFDGPTALKLAHEFRPQVVFLDIGMPGMDGYEVAYRLGQQPGLDPPLLVALTGWGREDDRRRSHEAGFHHHLVKPAEPGDLEALLADLKLPGG